MKEINLGVESLSRINMFKNEVLKNVFDENTRLHSVIMFQRYIIALIIVANIITYSFIGG
jgi:hypothetical protein